MNTPTHATCHDVQKGMKRWLPAGDTYISPVTSDSASPNGSAHASSELAIVIRAPPEIASMATHYGATSVPDSDSAHASGHTWRRALPASLVGLAVEFTWAAGESVIVPFLLEAGLAPSLSGLVFIANPLVTIPLHPVLGAWSDRCQSRLGRRRPVQPKPFSRLSLCGAHS